MSDVIVVGGGLAGSECAYQLAERGVRVRLIEQKPKERTPAQEGDGLAELVCSNSFRAAAVHNAVGDRRQRVTMLAGKGKHRRQRVRVAGRLGFALTGILASLAGALAAAGIPCFALSTFDTDYLLVRADDLPRATTARTGAGHSISDQAT